LRSGNLFDSDADAIVVTVNYVGIMGKGIAPEAKNRYPELFEQSVAFCNAGEMQLGRPVFFPLLLPPSVVLFPTQDHWRSFSKLSDIEAGLDYFVDHHRGWDITSIAVPPLGCGNGGLEWAVVGPAICESGILTPASYALLTGVLCTRRPVEVLVLAM
jgi:O-acetyl-ADP-ribose deacetylase (regulator of RNase III)